MPGAVRLGDMHLCQQVEGTVPHVGGPVGPVPKNLTVWINGRPAAVVGDVVVCVGRPDKLVTGIDSVKIGDTAAADSSAVTDHGGQIVLCSTDVLIG